MPEEKRKAGQLVLRSDSEFRALLDRMAARRESTITEYLRGLVLIDAMKAEESIDFVTVPGWATAEILRLHRESTLRQKDRKKK